ncbi:HPP family protein [Cyanobium sp. PCC 7001]|uniref:HPP family protein n=1 Tax=Cyanobium sp. PCC 7001 TaxID=180281 RepID=UPI001CED4DD3|nr:HPP family protein [Cyanobium sp. PCC 7001]
MVAIDTVGAMVVRRLRLQRERGRAFQPRFASDEIVSAWLGAALAISALGLIGAWSHYPLVVAPFGASAVLLFGAPASPLAQPRNIVLGNTLGALVSTLCVLALGQQPWVMGVAVGLTIGLGQGLRCLHPPAGAVALLGVLLDARPAYVLSPILSGSVLLVLIAVLFHRLRPAAVPYPHHWL